MIDVQHKSMRKQLGCVSALLFALSGCAPAAANALDPSSDLDCALTTYYFYEVAINSGAPEKPTAALRIFNQWFAVNLKHSGRTPTPAELQKLSDTIQSDHRRARRQLDACIKRASDDEQFTQFAQLMAPHV